MLFQYSLLKVFNSIPITHRGQLKIIEFLLLANQLVLRILELTFKLGVLDLKLVLLLCAVAQLLLQSLASVVSDFHFSPSHPELSHFLVDLNSVVQLEVFEPFSIGLSFLACAVADIE